MPGFENAMPEIPAEIWAECLKEQKRMGWPAYVPTYVEFYDTHGHVRYGLHTDLTVATAEQACEGHIRQARKAIAKWKHTQLVRWARRAARHIIRARLYRCSYLTLLGKEGTEADMPFANGRDP